MVITWKLPPKIKIYEALGALADGRVEVGGDSVKVYSSSRGKYYTVAYDPKTQAIMANDNGSYWQDYLGYPALVYLMKIGVVPFSETAAALLADIEWKDINQSFKNDWTKTEKYCQDLVVERDGNLGELLKAVDEIHAFLQSHPFPQLGKKMRPPAGY